MRTVALIHIFLGALVLFEVLAVCFYWLGRSWARQLVLMGCVFYLIGLKNLHEQWNHSHFGAELSVAAALLAVFLVWYLNIREVRTWFAASKLKPVYR